MTSGRLRKAPENFLDREGMPQVADEARSGRRDFLRGAFAAAAAGAALPAARAQTVGAGRRRPQHPEAARAFAGAWARPWPPTATASPRKYEANVQRRRSPGLTQTTQASVSFAPLQSLFGIVTPSGLHFERHHQGWWDIDPSKHRFMVNGMVKTPKVFTMDELMRLPVGVALPLHRMRREHRHGMGQRGRAHLPVHARHAVVQRVHRRAADHAAGDGGADLSNGQVRAGRGRATARR